MIRIVNFLLDPDKIIPVAEHVSVGSHLFIFWMQPLALCGFLLGSENAKYRGKNEATALQPGFMDKTHASDFISL